MKLENGRVYVLVNEEISHFKGDPEYRILVKLVGASDFEGFQEVEGFCCDENVDMMTIQTVETCSLKPASEKQLAIYNKKKKDILAKKQERMAFWL